jgi:cell pole-organizing protein PopZ
MADAKTKAANGGEDQSMEEILQSIRKIIAEENDEPVDDPIEPEIEEESEDDDSSSPDSDVLELTDAIQDDGSVVNVNDDVLDNIDNALEEAEDETPPPPPQPQVTAKPIAPPPPPPKPTPPSAGEGLVSSVSIAASAEAMRALKSGGNLGSLPFVSGETVEGLVMQLLRPMLKEWLDANLPGIVQQEVQREVQRITASMEQDR